MTQISRFLSKPPETTPKLLKRAFDYLEQIRDCFLANLDDLPSEIRRERQHFNNNAAFFALLDRHLHYNTLISFISKHPECLEKLFFVFGSKYPRLNMNPDLHHALLAADGTSSHDAQKFLTNKRPRKQQQITDDATWKPKRMRRENGAWVPWTKQQRVALQAFDDFQTADDDPLLPPSAQGQFLTGADFCAFEMQVSGAPKDAGEVSFGTHLQFTLPAPSPSDALPSLSMQTKAETTNISPVSDVTQYTPATTNSERTLVSPIQAAALIGQAVDDGRFMEYKGYLMEPPAAVLAKLKMYLSKPNVEQKANWARYAADIQEYITHLLPIRADARWEPQLDEVIDMFRAHTLYDDFHREHPGLDYSLWPEVMKPKIILHNPFAPPGQQDMTLSAVLGKRKAQQDEDETPLPLGEDDEFYDENPISYDNMMLEDVPAREAQDSFIFTRWNRRLMANMAQAADDARETTATSMEKLKEKSEGFVIMDVPQNWSGPVPATTLLDSEASKTDNDWTRLRALRTNLQRTARRSPRLLLGEVNKYVALGMTSKNPASAHTNGESSTKTTDSSFLRLQKEEINWLSFLCQASLNGTSSAGEAEAAYINDWKLAMLGKRIRKMRQSLVPFSFGDGQRISVRPFLDLVNQDCDGPVKGHRFTMQELKERIPQLVKFKLVSIEQIDGVQHIQCHPGEIHPEEAIRWPDDIGTVRRTRAKLWRNADADVSPSATTVPRVMPSMDDLRTIEECLTEQTAIHAAAERTVLFFQRLAYRLGRTLSEVASESAYQRWLASDAAHQTARAASLRTLLARWASDAAARPVPQCRNGRVVASYRDVVLAADPEALAGYRDFSDAETEAYCRDIVRRNVLREMAENKTMLWPVAVPRDSSLGEEEAPKDGRTVLRREAVWSFAQTRTKVRRFFDVNKWPLEMQSEETRARIRSQGANGDAMEID